MMEKKKGIPFWVNALMFILCVFAIAGNVNSVIKGQIGSIGGLVSGIAALVYCFLGYKKNAAVFFKAYCWLLFLGMAVVMFGHRAEFAESSVASTGLFLFMLTYFTCLCIMVFGKDLGKTKSMTLAYIMLGAKIVFAVLDCIAGWGKIESTIEPVMMGVVFCIMVYGKYMDKAARGTK